MGNGVSSLIFTCRSGDKAVHGDAARTIPFAAQGVNAAQGYAKTGLWGAKYAGEAVNSIDKLAKENTIWGKGARGLKWAQTHVNPIIGACAAIKIAVADDKEKAVCTEVPGFFGMIAAESGFKKLQKTQTARKVVDSITKAAGKHGKIAAALVEGLAFASASIGGYMVASKLGEYALEGERAIKARKKLRALA